jgi:hypothetical protein
MSQKVLSKLNERQKKFCREYVRLNENGAQAAIAAGYSAPTARITASQLLTNTNIKQYLANFRAKDEFKTVVAVEKQLQRLEMISSVTLDMFLTFGKKGTPTFKPMEEWTEAMKYAVEGYNYNSRGRLILKLHGKNWAADMLNKHLGLYEKDNRQQSGVQILLPGQAPVHLEKD